MVNVLTAALYAFHQNVATVLLYNLPSHGQAMPEPPIWPTLPAR